MTKIKVQLELYKLSNLYKDSPYYCIALDPHPAATSDDVTHPHVSNDKLCEGDGYAEKHHFSCDGA